MYNDPNQPPRPPYDPSRTQSEQPPYGMPPQQPSYPQQGYPGQGYPGGPGPNYPNYGAPPQKKKSSLRWLWITLGIVGGLFVLICAAIVIFVFVLGKTYAPTIGSVATATAYYTAIKNQDYATAYTYLDTSKVTSIRGQTMSEETFSRVGTLVDTERGKVSNFTIPNIDPQHPENVTIQVTRGSQTYDVHLVLAQVNNTWKITQIDNI